MAFYRSLLKEAGLEEEVEQELNQLIENKNNFGVEELLKNQEMEPSLKEAFLKMPELFGSIEQIKTARGLTENPDALAAILCIFCVFCVYCKYQKHLYFHLQEIFARAVRLNRCNKLCFLYLLLQNYWH